MTYDDALEVSLQWNLPLQIHLKIWKKRCGGSCAKSGLTRTIRVLQACVDLKLGGCLLDFECHFNEALEKKLQ
ncbi:hypothetical protein ACSBR1_019003 [Camellia fascicularis]